MDNDNPLESQELIEELHRLRTDFGLTDSALRSLADAANAAADAEKKQSAIKQAASTITGSLLEFGNQLQKNNTDLTSMSGAFEGLLSATGTLSSKIPFLGNVLESTFNGASKLVQPLLQEANKQLETFQSLSTVGAAAADGIDGLQERAFDTLLTLDKLKEIVGANAQGLALYGDTVSDGVKSFEEVQTSLANFDSGLRNLGVTTEEMAAGATAYMTLQAKMMRTEKLSQDQLLEGTASYIRELDEVARLTGKSRQELMKHDQEVMRESRWRALSVGMTQEGKGDQFKVISDIEKRLSAIAPTAGKGFRDLSTGMATTKEAQQLLRSIPGIENIEKQAKEGQITPEEATNQIVEAAKKLATSKGVYGLAQAVGDQPGAFLPYSELADLGEAGNAVKAKEESVDSEEKATNQTKNLTETQKNLERSSANIHKEFSKALPTMSVAMKEASKGFARLTEEINNLSDTIEDITGIEVPTSNEIASKVQSGFDYAKEAVSGAASTATNFIRDTTGIGREAMPTGPLTGGVKGMLDQISRGEGTTDEKAQKHGFKSAYDVPLGYGKYGGKTEKPLSEMTIGEVKEYQKRILHDPANKMDSSAVGKYQIVGKTLRGLQSKYGFGDEQKFDAAFQDKLGEMLLKGRGLDKFKAGKMSSAAFQEQLAQEWASIAHPGSGRGTQGTGTSSEQIQTAMGRLSEPETAVPSEPGSTEGLRLKSSEAIAGGAAELGTTHLAKAIQDAEKAMPGGLNRFTSVNDAYHHEHRPHSKHTEGLAFDFTINDQSKSTESAEYVKSMLKQSGLAPGDFKIIDEYKHSTGGTGGHIHVQFQSKKAAAKYAALMKGEKGEENVSKPEDKNVAQTNVVKEGLGEVVPYKGTQTVSQEKESTPPASVQNQGPQTITPTPPEELITMGVEGLTDANLANAKATSLDTIPGDMSSFVEASQSQPSTPTNSWDENLSRSLGNIQTVNQESMMPRLTSLNATGFGTGIGGGFYPSTDNIGGILGGIAGGALGGQGSNAGALGTIFGGVLGKSIGGNAPQGGIPGIGGIGGVLGGIGGTSIPPLGGMLGGLAGQVLGGGMGSIFSNLTSPSMVAPQGGYSGLETAKPQIQLPEDKPTGVAGPVQDGQSSDVLASLMTAQLDKLNDLSSLMRKQNTTTEKILKAQK